MTGLFTLIRGLTLVIPLPCGQGMAIFPLLCKYLKNSSGNIPLKFPHDLFISLGIEKYQNLCWRSFFRDGLWLNILCLNRGFKYFLTSEYEMKLEYLFFFFNLQVCFSVRSFVEFIYTVKVAFCK